MHQDQEMKKMKERLAETNEKLEKSMAEKNEMSAKLEKLQAETNRNLENCLSAIENSIRIISQYLLETNKVIDYDSIIKQGEPMNMVLPLLECNDRKFQNKFPPALPLHNTDQIQYNGVKYDFAELNAINKELSFLQQQQQEQHLLQQLTHQRRHKQQYEDRIEYFYDHAMEQGRFYYNGDREVFFKLKMSFETPVYFYYDPKIQSSQQSLKKGSIIFQKDDLVMFNHLNAVALHIKIEGYDHKNSDAHLYPYKQSSKKFLLRVGANSCPEVWSDYKSPKQYVLFHIEKRKKAIAEGNIKKTRATSLKIF